MIKSNQMIIRLIKWNELSFSRTEINKPLPTPIFKNDSNGEDGNFLLEMEGKSGMGELVL